MNPRACLNQLLRLTSTSPMKHWKHGLFLCPQKAFETSGGTNDITQETMDIQKTAPGADTWVSDYSNGQTENHLKIDHMFNWRRREASNGKIGVSAKVQVVRVYSNVRMNIPSQLGEQTRNITDATLMIIMYHVMQKYFTKKMETLLYIYIWCWEWWCTIVYTWSL